MAALRFVRRCQWLRNCTANWALRPFHHRYYLSGMRRMANGISSKLNMRAWDMQRFGLSPSKLVSRVSTSDGPRILCNSIPKSGTHLLERALCLHPQLYRNLRPTITDSKLAQYGGLKGVFGGLSHNQIWVAHLRYSDELDETLHKYDVRNLFLIRDPRDMIVSNAHYIPKHPEHRRHAKVIALGDVAERMRYLIQGEPANNELSIGELLDGFLAWMESDALVLRFEDLIGQDGGGDKQTQLDLLGSIYSYIGLPQDEASITKLANNLFSTASPTFRKGAINQWREQFDPDTKKLFKQFGDSQLQALGYGREPDW